MKRRILLVVAVLLILAGVFLLIKLAASTFSPRGRGALQVTTNIKATVFLDNKNVGQSPLCLCDQNQTINQGVHSLKIVPQDKTLEPATLKIDINSGVLTAVERTFLPGALSSSYILSLEKINDAAPQLFVASVPEVAIVSIDGESKDVTPYSQNDISASEHEVELTKVGFSKKTIRIRAVPHYKLVLNVVLGTESGIDETLTVTPAPTLALISPTPTIAKNSVEIKQTPTGFLNVRENASTGAKIIGQVNPGEIYEYTNENVSWYQIKLKDGTLGWISKTYATKLSQ